MTDEKARDFFSAYSEGNLDPGLLVSFEQKLSADAGLRAEYDRFAATLAQVSALRDVPIEIPSDLNDRIGARLDRQLWEQKQIAPKAWIVRLRLVTFAGVATLLLVGAAISIKNRNSGSDAFYGAGIAGGYPQTGTGGDQLALVVKQDGLTVEYAPSAQKTVVFRAEPDTKPFAEVTVGKSAPMTRALENKNAETDLVSIEVLDAPKVERLVVAIPGTHSERVKAGSGTLEEFARVLAAKYRVPVVLSGIKDPLSQVTWDLGATDARQAAEAALKGQFSVDTREGNLVTISRG
ncbi:MAG: anti-sigma factor [Fimbriimonadaceae bacterium]